MADAIERWLPAVGWEGFYEVSDRGRVRRIAGGMGATPARILTPFKSGEGYQYVNLWRENRKWGNAVHHLVLKAFIGPRPPGQGCNHKNGDKADNRPGNLEWATPLANVRHAVATGLTPAPRGAKNPNAKLTTAQVLEIRRLAGIESAKVTAARYGVMPNQIRNIRGGRAWREVP